jgi:hypothetical protein
MFGGKNKMNKKGFLGVLIVLLVIVTIGLLILFVVNYYKNHPCVEYKTYCYYYSHGFGVGMSSDSEGGAHVVPVFTSNKIYVECGGDLVPDIEKEEKCVKRK